ncbi:TPA: type II toxin-antitoxin system PemK/MazF family toxin [Staphylococcus aureus]|jgi:mRNA interferase MazF|uniref:type II toxin-antitoxin system PemK/MazF family toxin n=1 Tax=Staphylococcus TaxID=1279 RepID=UPI00229B23BD|nr:type II toxin-antitoxin system PemK/MazF family toxin [Dermabacter sp.]HCY7075304.1 type II toxin-antitoxin system PemK/MazF family toxin [Staphylococcus aureus]HDA7749550.1 type II toxin-antitoxin system PemK/MazF family toxin [Staphylococcus aureus]
MVNQYDVIKLDFNPVIGNEKGNYRPCLVISDSEFNHVSGFIWVIPITSRDDERYPTDVLVETENQRIHGVIDCAHIKSVDIHARPYRHFDILTSEKVIEVNDRLKGILHL